MKQNKISTFVREKRKEIGLSQIAMAKEIGVGVRFYKALEQGKMTLKMDKVSHVLAYFGAELSPYVVDPSKGCDPSKTIKISPMQAPLERIDMLYDSAWEKVALSIVKKVMGTKKHNLRVPFYDGKEFFYENEVLSKEMETSYYQCGEGYERLYNLAFAQSEDYGVDLADFWKQVIVRWVMGIDSIRLTNAKNDKAVVTVKKEMFDTVALSINSKRHSISRGDFFEAMVHTGMKECDANSLIEEVVSDEKKIMLFIESAKISQENKGERKIFTRSRIISLKYQL